MGFFENVMVKVARSHGIRVISDDEKWEAERIGADNASKIYEPIFNGLVEQHKELEKIVADKKSDYEDKKDILKNTYLKLQEEVRDLQEQAKASDDEFVRSMAEHSSSLQNSRGTWFGLGDISTALGNNGFAPIFGSLAVEKESVQAYRDAIEIGFNRTKDIFEKKIKAESEKINTVIRQIVDFDKNKDETFEQAMEMINGLIMEKKFYEGQLSR